MLNYIHCMAKWDMAYCFQGYDFTGANLSIFPLIPEWALQQCTALPVILASATLTITVDNTNVMVNL